jgi:predicted nucleotidyltransferase
MITNIFDKDCAKILTVFGLSPGSRFIRKDLQTQTRLYNVPLDSSLQKLISASIISKSEKYYSLKDRDVMGIISKEYRRFKELPLATYFAIMDLAYMLSSKPADIILFGSYAKLTYNIDSDVDVAVIGDVKVNEKSISNIERTYGKRIQVHYFTKEEFYKNKNDALVKSILKDGIRITER